MSIQTSFKVSSKVGTCDWPCFSKKRNYIDRENLSFSRVRGLEDLFDRIDDIFSVNRNREYRKVTNQQLNHLNILQATSLTPLIWALIPLIGIGVSIPLIIYQYYSFLWMPFVFSQLIVQPFHSVYFFKRKRGLRRALIDWNRSKPFFPLKKVRYLSNIFTKLATPSHILSILRPSLVM